MPIPFERSWRNETESLGGCAEDAARDDHALNFRRPLVPVGRPVAATATFNPYSLPHGTHPVDAVAATAVLRPYSPLHGHHQSGRSLDACSSNTLPVRSNIELLVDDSGSELDHRFGQDRGRLRIRISFASGRGRERTNRHGRTGAEIQ